MRRPVPIQGQAPPPAANFNQQMLSSGLSDMNQPAGLTMVQHHLSLLTPEAWVALFSQMQKILPPPPPPLLAPLVPVIQPNLELLSLMQDLARRMEGIEKDVSTIKHQNVNEDLATDGDVDTEEENQPCPQQKHAKKKKSKEQAYIPNVAKVRLTAAQLTTCSVQIVASALQSAVTKTYQECLHKTIYDLTGLIASEIGSDGSDDTMSNPPKMMFDFQAGTPYAPIKMYEQDPRGFKKREGQHDEDLPQGNSEKASKNGSTDSHSVNGDGDGDDGDDILDGDL
ncbi:uncharacterized protein F5891DRAFT_1194307 [Suillus fuscotomentosus]|uniref:Uncharacterized protein n=1 Tax=Suillus fuscotomentosus TaxID=1912939 RepID=A0AAD4DWF2_9AGAM|nr:uncharacterized protein F5891DRAFT_1194307 [Suillus fuscotomentosus]KAG1895252.1 hypothetical protein F5891DRAFT_1194307 [Suillus fuscotomentosus]